MKMYRSPEEAVQVVKVQEVYEPNVQKHKIYTDRFELYKQMYPLFGKMNRML